MGTYRTAPMDTPARIGTALISILMVGCAAVGVLVAEMRPLITVAVLLAVTAWFSWRIAPKRYEATGEAVVIVRGWPFRDISIPVSGIREVRRVTLSPWKTVRTFGVGGLFSYSGRFWARDVGKFYGGVTDFGRAVLIDAGERYVISPENPDDFVRDIRVMI